MDEKKIDIKVDEHVALGQYSNLAAIRHTKEEFLFDFAFVFPDGPLGKLVSRVIVSPAHAKRFMEALEVERPAVRGGFRPHHSRRYSALGRLHPVTSARGGGQNCLDNISVFLY